MCVCKWCCTCGIVLLNNWQTNKMAHNNNNAHHHRHPFTEYVTDGLEPKLEQQSYVLPSSSYNQVASTEQQDSPEFSSSQMTNGFFGAARTSSTDNRHSNKSNGDVLVRYNDDPREQLQYYAANQQSFEEQPQQQRINENAPVSWFSWLPSAMQSTSARPTIFANDQPQSVLASHPITYVSNDNTVLINSILDSANMSGLPVDINSAYEANRIQIQDVYRAVEFEMHRRLTVPLANQHRTLSEPNDYEAKTSSSPSSSSLCISGNTAKLSSLLGGAKSSDQPNDSAWLTLLQKSAGSAGDVSNSAAEVSSQVANRPSVFFGASQTSDSKTSSIYSKSGNSCPPTPIARASTTPVLMPPSTSNAKSSTITPTTLTEYINIQQVMKSQQPTTTSSDKKTFQKPLSTLTSFSQHQRRSLTTTLAGTPKKRTAVFSQFTGVDTTAVVTPTGATHNLEESNFASKKIKTELSDVSASSDGTGVDDEESYGDDISEHSYSDASLVDVNGRAVAAVLAPLAARDSHSSTPATATKPTGADARDNVLVCYTFWRLALVKKVRREVTLGEIRRRLAPPESFTLSQLGSLLRLAKVRGSGPALKQRLEHYGLKVESSQRTQARQTLFMALLESEANTMAQEYKTLCMRHFPRRSLAEYFVYRRQSNTSASPNGTSNNHTRTAAATTAAEKTAGQPDKNDVTVASTIANVPIPDKSDDLIACADTLAELRNVLLLDRSPLMAQNTAETNSSKDQLSSLVQLELNNFSASTHGFGTQTIVHHIALLEDVLKFMARCYTAPPNVSVVAGMGGSIINEHQFDPRDSAAMLGHQHHQQQQPVPQQHW